MKQDHYAFASEIRNLQGPFSSVKVDAGYTDYEHREIEGGETGTTFKNKGYEARVEARHQRIGPFDGVIGAQSPATSSRPWAKKPSCRRPIPTPARCLSSKKCRPPSA
jgi:hypothetical protein